MRKLSLVIAGILGAGSPWISQAATLGQAQVQSYLSEPLEVRVPLMRSSDEPLDEITVQLAPPSFYREAGVPLANLGGNLTFAIRSEHGQEYVLIGSKRPIRDPILSILLQVESPQGRMIRSYNLLLDPPNVTSSAPDKAPPDSTAATRTRTTAAPKPSSSSAWQRVKPAGDVDLDATRTVERGDTLYEIARDYVGDGEDVRPMMQAIIDANPQAFANGNGNAMMAGAELKVPTTSASEAKTAEKSQADADTGTEGIQRLPALELLSPANESEPTASRGFGQLSRDNPLRAISEPAAAPTQPMDRESALEQEELESVKAENEALTEQLRELRDQIDSVKVAVDDRDAQIAELKEVIDKSRQEAQAAEAAQASFWVQWGKYLTGGLGLLVLALLIALGLRRRRDDTPAVPMPATADVAGPSQPEEPVIHRPSGESEAPAATALGAAAGIASTGTGDLTASAEEGAARSSADDPMNPEMALEEAHVLESFNLTHQALELLQDSLAEHPGHAGLQAAIARLSGEQDVSESTAEVPLGSESMGEGEETAAEPTEENTAEQGIDTAEEAPTAPKQENAAGEISWDEDVDDMLATPEPDAEQEQAPDDTLMEFDDSFALETPAGDRESVESEADEPSVEADASLDIPGNETPAASVDTETEDARVEPEPEPEPMDLDLSGYEPAGETEPEKPVADEPEDTGLELDLTPGDEEAPAEEPPVESAADSGSDADVDTRVSLAEAFLDVGDRESFDMLEAELREEGATAALERLDELKARHEGNG